MNRFKQTTAVDVCAAAALAFMVPRNLRAEDRPAARPELQSAARTVNVEYRFVVRGVPAAASSVVAWIPLPPTNAHQRLLAYEVTGDFPHELVKEAEYGNRFLRFDLSAAARHDAGEAAVIVHLRVTRVAIMAPRTETPAPRFTDPPSARFLLSDRLVPIDGKVAAEARRIAGDAIGAIDRARRLYDYIVSTVHYDKSGQGWGRGDAIYACDVRHGNCTDFHSLFIGEARALGIPARFVMGLPLPSTPGAGSIPGYHCWAEFYAPDLGWLPLDASEASRHPEERDALFAALDANRIAFSIGRDIRLPAAAAGPVNYSIYPHVEVDGEEFSQVQTSFTFRDEPRSLAHATPVLTGQNATRIVDHISGNVEVR